MLTLNYSFLTRKLFAVNFLKALGFDHFYVQSPCNVSIKIYHAFYNVNVPSIHC
jgi:hypothetical protein